MKETLVGYHGTTKHNRDLIWKQKKFRPSISKEQLDRSLKSHKNTYLWLGDGIYFWHNNEQRAFHWAKDISRKTKEGSGVLRVPITYELCRCFDLTKKEHYNIIKNVVETLYIKNKEAVNLDQISQEEKYKFVGAACDFLFTGPKMSEKYDLVYAGFTIKKDKLQIFDEVTHQICVKNDTVIEYSRMEIV